jgi:probable F420-dependent oxidoreductase
LKFGCQILGVKLRDLAEVAQLLERGGFESIWIPEHLAQPAEMPASYPYSESGLPPIGTDTPCYDPWVTLAFIAQATTRIRLATNVFVLPLRHPLQTARSVVTLDRLSGGRVTLGIGVGWLRDEFDWLGLSFEERGQRADAIIPILKRLWTEEIIEHHDEHFAIGPLRFEPKPFQNPLPIEVGGTSPAALRRAGRLGDGWIELGSADLDELGYRIGVISGHRRAAGRDHVPFEVTASGRALSAVADLRRAGDLGVTRTLSAIGALQDRSVAGVATWIERFGNDVMSKL